MLRVLKTTTLIRGGQDLGGGGQSPPERNIFTEPVVVLAAQTRKTRIIDVVYNASNNELVRTKTLVKNAIVQVDSTPFRQWYEAHYATPIGRKKGVKLVSALRPSGTGTLCEGGAGIRREGCLPESSFVMACAGVDFARWSTLLSRHLSNDAPSGHRGLVL